MANIHSQKKRDLRSERERLENRRYTSGCRTYFHRLETAVAGGDDAAADAEHRALVSAIDKAVKRARCTATPAPARSAARRACGAAARPSAHSRRRRALHRAPAPPPAASRRATALTASP